MILDHLSHADHYPDLWRGLGPRIMTALDFLRHPSTASREPQALGSENSLRVDIAGDDVFALVQRYITKPPSEAFWEAHRKYIDVQCVLEGEEMMGHAPLHRMDVVQRYDEAKDFAKVKPVANAPEPNWLRVSAGMFAVFFPHDAHMPGLAVEGTPHVVKKIVVKVRLE